MSIRITPKALSIPKFTQTKIILRLQRAMIRRDIFDLKDFKDGMSRRFPIPDKFESARIDIKSGYYFTRQPKRSGFVTISDNILGAEEVGGLL